jgi:chorismate mutase
MNNLNHALTHGVYQGGNAFQFTDDLKLEGDEILYIGDHIYGDILRLKKDCNWRTAMVLEELEHEVESNVTADPLVTEIERLMKFKEPLEDKLTDLMTLKTENKPINEEDISKLQEQISGVDAQISQLIKKQQSLYNPQWGQLMRAGNEESYLAYQVERYACVYMSKLSDLVELSPRTYFRAPRRPLSHENV